MYSCVDRERNLCSSDFNKQGLWMMNLSKACGACIYANRGHHQRAQCAIAISTQTSSINQKQIVRGCISIKFKMLATKRGIQILTAGSKQFYKETVLVREEEEAMTERQQLES